MNREERRAAAKNGGQSLEITPEMLAGLQRPPCMTTVIELHSWQSGVIEQGKDDQGRSVKGITAMTQDGATLIRLLGINEDAAHAIATALTQPSPEPASGLVLPDTPGIILPS